MKTKSVIMNKPDMERSLQRMALEIVEKNSGLDNVYLVGIRSRGVPMAQKIAQYLKQIEGEEVEVGILDITLYRDDLSQIAESPVHKDTIINFDIKNSIIVLIDDVLYTGRTVRAAIDGLLSFGRPQKIQLGVLIDRGHHEMPVKADFVGREVPTSQSEVIKVAFESTDGEENVKIMQK